MSLARRPLGSHRLAAGPRHLALGWLAIGALVAGLLGTGGPSARAAAGSTPSAGSAALTGPAVTLITGDRVVVHPGAGGRQLVAIQARDTQHAFATQRIGADQYVIPASVLPYLGRSLDRALFDISALLRDNASARLLVKVTFASGASQAAPAGVTFTGTAGPLVRTGYLTPASAGQFGAALSRQLRTDATAHWRGDRRLFGTVTLIRYGGTTPTGVAQPNFPMHTVKIKVLGEQGQLAPFGDLTVLDVDSSLAYSGSPTVIDGDVRISVPAGNFSSLLFYPVLDSAGTLSEVRLVQTDFAVSGPREVTVDARRATSLVSIHTPKPASLLDLTSSWARGSSDADLSSFSIGLSNLALRVSPTPVVSAGVLHYYVAARSESPAGVPQPYSYDVEFPSDGAIPANQSYRVHQDSLAAIDTSYYTDDPGRPGGVTRFGVLPWEFFQLKLIYPIVQPLRRTEYVTVDPNIIYSELLVAILSNNQIGGFTDSGNRVYRQPERVFAAWLHGPLAPGIPADTGVGSYFCSACRNGDDLSVLLAPVIDSTPDHAGYLDTPGNGVVSTSRFQLFQGATRLADLADQSGGEFTVPAAAEKYTIVYDQTRQAPWFTQSTQSHTEWTFGSAHSGSQTVPDRWVCRGSDTACSALSLLTVNYQLGVDLNNQAAPGPGSLLLTVSHASGAPAVPITAASVALSFDGGTTWTPAAQRDLGGGRYRVRWTNPASASGGPVDMRVTATDATGATISQTVRRAYQISPARTASPAIASPATTRTVTATGATKPAYTSACPVARPGQARCLAGYRPAPIVHSGRSAGSPPAGYGPADLRSAYRLPATGSTKTVAVVVGYDYPTAAADLATYRRTYGLPACTAASGCFRKVNQNGKASPLPAPDAGWAVEAALDLQMASAGCPTCKLLIVEGNEPSFEALATAENTAVRLGASVVSNSYGIEENNGQQQYAAAYHHPGVPILASSGDAGFTAASFPAVLPTVIAVGGTTLHRASNSRGWTETVWSGSGSGCSAWWAKPAWQHDPNCQMGTTADISAVADPDTGVAVYDTYGLGADAGWLVVGGTSVSSPLLAGVIALASHPERVTGQSLYGKPAGSFFDVVGGSNGYCGEDYLCTGLPGYDAPSGLGTPDGVTSFI